LVGAHTERDGYNLLKDAEILNLLNKTAELEKDTPNIQYQSFNHHEIDKAKQFLQDKIKSLNLPFSYPELIEHSIFLASNTLDQYQNNPT
jgi:hypothetical protein